LVRLAARYVLKRCVSLEFPPFFRSAFRRAPSGGLLTGGFDRELIRGAAFDLLRSALRFLLQMALLSCCHWIPPQVN
jgi:hypothetical protein